jgi:hypothetical protein
VAERLSERLVERLDAVERTSERMAESLAESLNDRKTPSERADESTNKLFKNRTKYDDNLNFRRCPTGRRHNQNQRHLR